MLFQIDAIKITEINTLCATAVFKIDKHIECDAETIFLLHRGRLYIKEDGEFIFLQGTWMDIR